MTRNIGDMAEAELKKWAGQENITANPSISDREGWDFILQFPYNFIKNLPLDLQPARIECFLQVKGIGTNEKRLSIPISNWMKLVYTPLPAFFLIISYSSGVEPQDAYLVHINEKLISKVIKRLRSFQKKDFNSLNKKTIGLSWQGEDRLMSLDGKGLRAAIQTHIGENFNSYVSKKENFRKEIGIEAPFIINVTSEPHESIDSLMEELVDFAIGIKDEISVSKIIVEEHVRFGIPANKIEKGKGFLSIIDRSQTGKSIKVTLSNKTGNIQSDFDGVLYSPDFMFPDDFTQKKYRKIRVETEIGDFIVDSRKKTNLVRLKLGSFANPRKLSELVNIWRVVKILEISKKEGGFIEITDNINSTLHLELVNIGTVPEIYLDVLQTIENAWFLARFFDLPSDLKIFLEDIVNSKYLLSEVCFLCNLTSSIGISFDLDGESEFDSAKEYVVVLGRKIKLGTKILSVIIGLAGNISFNPFDTIKGLFLLKFPKRVYLEHNFSQEMEDDMLKFIIKKAEDSLTEKGFSIIPNHIS